MLLQPIKAPVIVGKPSQSVHCAGPPTRQPADCTSTPPLSAQKTDEAPMPASHENTASSSCDIDERLHPDALWIFPSLLWRKSESLVFVQRFILKERWKPVLGERRRDQSSRSLFSLRRGRTRVATMSFWGWRRRSKSVANSDLRVLSGCPKAEWEKQDQAFQGWASLFPSFMLVQKAQNNLSKGVKQDITLWNKWKT